MDKKDELRKTLLDSLVELYKVQRRFQEIEQEFKRLEEAATRLRTEQSSLREQASYLAGTLDALGNLFTEEELATIKAEADQQFQNQVANAGEITKLGDSVEETEKQEGQ